MLESVLVTGAYGCIGAWVTKLLVEDGRAVVALDAGSSDHRLRAVVPDVPTELLTILNRDVTDLDAVLRLWDEHEITAIIHLAALQVPFCKANPSLGAAVNVVGTVNMFEAYRQAGLTDGPLVYASSVAAYDAVEHAAESSSFSGHPSTHYGVYKRANEGNAAVYWDDNDVASIGLRPYVVYGPGRDQGMTSAPTAAVLAAVRGEHAHIPYGGRSQMQYVRDVAATFVQAAGSNWRGAGVWDLGGAATSMEDFVGALESAVPGARDLVTYDDKQLPFPEEVSSANLESAIGRLPRTSLVDGVRLTVEHFRASL